MPDEIRHDRYAALAAPVDARIFEGRVARIHAIGDPLRYSWGDEHRDVAELERITSQLIGKKLVLIHPEDSPENHHGMLEDGADAHVIGEIIGARVDGEWAIAKFLVTDAGGLAAVAEGIRELSLGYRCRTDESGFQRDTRVDHVAVVPRGRCGRTCALRADCGCQVADSPSELRRETIAVGGSTGRDQCGPCKSRAVGHSPLDMADEDLQKKLDAAQAEVENQRNRAAKLEVERDQATVRADQADKAREKAEIESANARKDLEKVQGEVGAERARADQADQLARDAVAKAEADAKAAADKVRADADADFEAKIVARVELLTAATPIVGKTLKVKNDKGEDADVDIVKMSERDIKLAVVKRVDGDDLTAKSDDYVTGVFEGALKRAKTATESRAQVREAIEQVREEAKTPTEPKTGRAAEKRALDQMRERLGAR